ncbi:hypothetical protein MKZ38_003805 [Zalerion maritima]|uniref:Uncharacterized protein n=1 Tax=Zalerion maritima TaxID=339359 RepID=A0AAD5WQ09_9PEZI|nr:hypothetical protein MKZ38_003805 [Zalerion maritima]
MYFILTALKTVALQIVDVDVQARDHCGSKGGSIEPPHIILAHCAVHDPWTSWYAFIHHWLVGSVKSSHPASSLRLHLRQEDTRAVETRWNKPKVEAFTTQISLLWCYRDESEYAQITLCGLSPLSEFVQRAFGGNTNKPYWRTCLTSFQGRQYHPVSAALGERQNGGCRRFWHIMMERGSRSTSRKILHTGQI